MDGHGRDARTLLMDAQWLLHAACQHESALLLCESIARSQKPFAPSQKHQHQHQLQLQQPSTGLSITAQRLPGLQGTCTSAAAIHSVKIPYLLWRFRDGCHAGWQLCAPAVSTYQRYLRMPGALV